MGVGKLIVFDGKMGMRKFGSAAPPSGKVACAVELLRKSLLRHIIVLEKWNDITRYYAAYISLSL